MERTLASIQKIINVQPIPNADAIEVATVLGWQVVVKKGEFKPNDYCIYVEIDSILPDTNPAFEFMRKSDFRVKTVKLRKQISQGICFSPDLLLPYVGDKLPCLTVFPEGTKDTTLSISDYIKEGMDVTELLGIKKYEPPLPAQLAGRVEGRFPSFIPKTDETRLQGVLSVLEDIKGVPLSITLKMDGSSSTFYYRTETKHFGVCSRNLELKPEEENAPPGWKKNTFWDMADKYNLKEKMEKLAEEIGSFAIQAECIGPGIQGNKMGLAENDIMLFSAYSIKNGHYYNATETKNIADVLGVKTVPVISWDTPKDLSLNEWLEYAAAQKYDNGSPAEGIVIRPMTEMFSDRLHGRLSFKVISNTFLLRYGE